MMKCENCAYFWKEEEDDYPACHWEIRCPGDQAPCEEEEYEGDGWDESEPEDWELAGYSSEEDYIEDMKAQIWIDAWKNGDFDE